MLLALPLAAQADIIKCVNATGQVAYQDSRCPAGAEETVLKIRGGRVEAYKARTQPLEAQALARFRLSSATPFFENNNGGLEEALRAPSLKPGTVIFITEIERVGDDDLYRAFTQSGSHADFGWIYVPALMGQDESLPLIDWNNALKEADKVAVAAEFSNGFAKLPEFDSEQYCADYASEVDSLGVDQEQARTQCLEAQQRAFAELNGRFESLPFIIRQTCSIESVIESSGSYDELFRCVEIKEQFSGDELTFPG
ncbi:DUF4124 domain-containing protein [Vreelandella lionensis]|uniref:DUF4124 domain-containing protein n=1 Tax=Vreelandella lionensis TaxID=1144478 RepID=A0ABW8BRG0_9GAMM